MKNTKKRLLVLATMLLIIGNSVTVFAGEKWGDYDCQARGYVHTMLTSSGWGQHAGTAGVYVTGLDADLLRSYNCGTQFGGTGVWDTVGGYSEKRNIVKKKQGYFTYVNAWLETDYGYIDAPEGH